VHIPDYQTFLVRVLSSSRLQAIVEGQPPDLPDEGYSDTARAFVLSCLNKVPKLRPSYSALLASDWLKPLTKPEVITEDDEEVHENNASAEAVAGAAGGLDLSHSSTEDPEVAAWVNGVLEKKSKGDYGQTSAKPALHAAPLDAATSPMTSPAVAR
jgi:mitogen-activated protein kinase kinase